ncbi:sigma-54 interaction domain-containing protein [Desulfospira joergensenii]|uniref:sigma-54 interaction domain-containing protein n=1 Tax=Desulfospira joergensenii TaxID=53329 RepID=UPI0003B4DE76|nr:sigma 54-interacting transcriptional regulator [Desulfospira joergensenii]
MDTPNHQINFDPIRIIGESSGLARVMEQVEMVAGLDTSVLLMGETGVGKGLIAREIHKVSIRRNGPFVNVNCGAIPETLVDSELFGHEKGSFTGALAKKQGRFELANKGTIFLDEIGELPLPVQVRLLHVLQTREIERVGGIGSFSLDIRMISATHRNLDAMVSDGTFREDLWFRLNVFPIHIPPLRRRKSDIPELARYFIRKKAGRLSPGGLPEIERKEIEQLQDYHWPGNVRELENIIERAMICSRNRRLSFSGLIPGKGIRISETGMAEAQGSFLSLDQINRIHIRKALASAKGKINGPGGAAQLLNIHPNTLRKRMDRLGIPYGKNLTRQRSLESAVR